MKIGLFGGTFDPIHFGHLIIGEWIREDCGLERVIYIPAGNPPHKISQEITPVDLRLAMVNLSINGNPHFSVSDIEKDPGKFSFTVDTLRNLVNEMELKKEDLYLIVGEDSLRDMPVWKEPEEIAKLCRIIVARRQGVSTDYIDTSIFSDALYSSVPIIDISSSDIRIRIREGKSIKYMVPSAVEEFIEEKGLYKGT